jgi:hypothetical protein
MREECIEDLSAAFELRCLEHAMQIAEVGKLLGERERTRTDARFDVLQMLARLLQVGFRDRAARMPDDTGDVEGRLTARARQANEGPAQRVHIAWQAYDVRRNRTLTTLGAWAVPSIANTDPPRTVRMDERDNVAIVANDGGLPAGTEVTVDLILREFVPQGHKLALLEIAAGSPSFATASVSAMR